MKHLGIRLRLSALLIFLFLFPLFINVIGTSAQSAVDLTVHYVEGVPKKGELSYEVKIYLSALDAGGNPIKDLTESNFTVTEDSKEMDIEAVTSVSDEKISLVLLLDTSGSMAGQKLSDAREAASNFVSSLGTEDQVAVIGFNEHITRIIDFTSDIGSVQNQINLIKSASSGTCLYDAVHEAVQITSTLPTGRRAIIVLTDGIDEIYGGDICSTFTLEDVIEIASTSGTRVPVYAIGLGKDFDEQGLERLAAKTGGRFHSTVQASQLNSLFELLANQLKSQYVITYTSTEAYGDHNVSVQVSHLGATDVDSRRFLLPPFPVTIRLVSPIEDQEVSGLYKVITSATGDIETISEVKLFFGDQEIDQVNSLPFEFEVDFNNYEPGETKITVSAQDSGGNELGSDEINIEIVRGASGGQVEDSEDIAAPDSEIGTGGGSFSITPLFYIIGGVVLIAGVAFFIIRRRKSYEEDKPEWGTMELGYQRGEGFSDMTVDDISIGGEVFAVLTVINSDDEAMIGQQLNLSKPITKIGRSAENEIVITDSPISRFHAQIQHSESRSVLSEIVTQDEAGSIKTPTYGTYVNDKQVKGDVLLHNGDEIRLGPRAKLRFDSITRISSADEDMTMDDIDLEDLSDQTSEVPRD